MSDPDNVITEMTDEECWEFLRSHEFGRLAFHLFGEVDITPINYVVDEQNQVIFRTAEGNKLLAVATESQIAFEVDETSQTEASSVILKGRAKMLELSAAEAADELPLRPWVPTLKYNYVALTAEKITGRRFELGPEPERTYGVY